MSFQRQGDWVLCVGGYDRDFVDFLKYTVKPSSFRSYDTKRKVWSVHHTWLPHVVPVARAKYDEVDWASLPTEWQLRIAGAKTNYPQAVDKPVNRSPYAVLYVTEDAPIEVVHASYKALARKHHPDVAGDQNKMAELNEAYEEISKKLRKR